MTAVLAIPSAPGQIGAIVADGIVGWGILRGGATTRPETSLAIHPLRAWSVAGLVIIFALLVGLPFLSAVLLAALYKSVWTSAIFGSVDFAIGITAFPASRFLAVLPCLVVIFGAAAATIIASIPGLNG